MNRRNFLKIILATSMAPAIVKAENIMKINSKILVPEDGFYIDWRTKQIGWTHHIDASNFTIEELYNYVKDHVRSEEILAFGSENIVNLQKPFNLTRNALIHAENGTLFQNDEAYCHFFSTIKIRGGTNTPIIKYGT